ncbi:hypothetical protein Btru_076923 [Bulinus truncatus]|nr:hypothetical protein Btru_076923 [Bulinus truncatus]
MKPCRLKVTKSCQGFRKHESVTLCDASSTSNTVCWSLGFIGDAVNKVVDTAGRSWVQRPRPLRTVDAGVNTASKVITTSTKTAVSVVKTVVDRRQRFLRSGRCLVPGEGGDRCPSKLSWTLLSIGASNFKKVLSLVANMAVSFTFGATNVRFGLVVYSTNAQIWLNLNDYSSIFDRVRKEREREYRDREREKREDTERERREIERDREDIETHREREDTESKQRYRDRETENIETERERETDREAERERDRRERDRERETDRKERETGVGRKGEV